MKVTLRQAHRLVEKITSRSSTIELSSSAAVNVHDQRSADDVIVEAKTVYTKALQRRQDLAGARQEIRSAVQAQNAAEINGLVSVRKGLLDQVAILREVVASFNKNAPSSAEVLTAKLTAERSAGNRYGNDSVSFNVITQADRDALEKQITDMQLRIEAVEDQLATSNAASLITLSDVTERVLRTEGIIQ